MSVTFCIKNTERKIMSPNELLACSNGKLSQFSIKEDHDNYQEIMNAPLNHFGVLLFGELGVSGRGSEISYDEQENSYDIRVNTPSTISDWHIALCFIENIATHLQTNVIDEHGTIYAPNNVDYDFMQDINFGIKSILAHLKNEDSNSVIFSILRPIVINKKMANQILEAEDMAKEFSNMLDYQLYHFDAFIASQMFFQKENNEIFGHYVLTQDVVTILPYEHPPIIDITQYNLEQKDITQWQISLMTHKGDPNKEDDYQAHMLPYDVFLERMPKNKCVFLDGHYMVIQLNRKELLQLVNPDKESGFFGKIKNLFQ
ncbi:MAG: DUF4299 family protein [Capnocytophaga sp.]|nr:DUF4299 family protein [Capnocytophaga sp.]